MKSQDINHRCGDKKFAKGLTRKNKRTLTGRQAMDAELKLSKVDLAHSNTKSIDDDVRLYIYRRHLLSEFYYGNTMVINNIALELQRQTYKHILCSEERRRVQGFNKGLLVLFIGNKEYCINSRIKGFQKYGGLWRPKIHAQYTTASITNEYNTSQTCPFRFKKTTHPLKIVNSQLKTVERQF
jgi:hypothetical protein